MKTTTKNDGKQMATHQQKGASVPTKSALPSTALAAKIKKQHGLVLRAFREGLGHARRSAMVERRSKL